MKHPISSSLAVLSAVLCLAAGSLTASCSDFFETDSDYVIFADEDHLTGGGDSIYSVIGILNKLQAIGDRTILLGEARGDLMDVTDRTPADLRDVALFNVGDDNAYNVPRDYYAIINNCNYFIAHADTALRNNRNEYLFLKEYAVVKSIRAWTYLQLVTTYGRVPFVTEPILSKDEAERDYPMRDIQGVCDYFLHDDGLQQLAEVDYPGYGTIKRLPSSLFYIPVYIILGDLNLWAGHYLDAARCYYAYIARRNGTNSTYPTSTASTEWMSSHWDMASTSILSQYWTEDVMEGTEVIALIPGDSIPSEGYYSRLREVFNSSGDNDYQVSLTPSQAIIDLSAAQQYCYFDRASSSLLYAPHTIGSYMDGDLRLSTTWSLRQDYAVSSTQTVDYQTIYKYQTGNVHIYRRQQVYLRLAEALNRAGYPRFAYHILSSGVNSTILTDSIIPAYSADAQLLSQFDFPSTRYIIDDPLSAQLSPNTQGIHSRGSGLSLYNQYYRMPVNPEITDSLAQIAWQVEQVEDMIVDEEALELAFEGFRFYDLMRVALRRGDPSYLSDRIYGRRGADRVAEMKALIPVDLTDPTRWYLHWDGQIGY